MQPQCMHAIRDFCNYLRAERELRQIPLNEIAAATKIPIYSLENLEMGNWDHLPPDVFVRGFVRSYARHVGLPDTEACLRYAEALGKVRQEEQAALHEPVGDAATEVSSRRRFGLALLVIIVLILATITLSLLWRSSASPDVQAAADPAPERVISRQS